MLLLTGLSLSSFITIYGFKTKTVTQAYYFLSLLVVALVFAILVYRRFWSSTVDFAERLAKVALGFRRLRDWVAGIYICRKHRNARLAGFVDPIGNDTQFGLSFERRAADFCLLRD